MIAVLKYFIGNILLLMPSLAEVETKATSQSFSQRNLQVKTIPKIESIYRSIVGESSTTIMYKNL